jgi:hypothetical protein
MIGQSHTMIVERWEYEESSVTQGVELAVTRDARSINVCTPSNMSAILPPSPLISFTDVY